MHNKLEYGGSTVRLYTFSVVPIRPICTKHHRKREQNFRAPLSMAGRGKLMTRNVSRSDLRTAPAASTKRTVNNVVELGAARPGPAVVMATSDSIAPIQCRRILSLTEKSGLQGSKLTALCADTGLRAYRNHRNNHGPHPHPTRNLFMSSLADPFIRPQRHELSGQGGKTRGLAVPTRRLCTKPLHMGEQP